MTPEPRIPNLAIALGAALALVLAPPASAGVALTSNSQHTCVLTSGGGLTCFGTSLTGQLGEGTSGGNTTPLQLKPVEGLPLPVRDHAAGFGFSCAVLVDGSGYCWGRNTMGQLGNGGNTETTRATVPVTGLAGATVVEAGADHACAIVADGEVRCWGNNTSGQLGDGTTTRRLTPVPVAGLRGVIQLALGSASSCALLEKGEVQCWGNNSTGQLGIAASTSRPQPAAVPEVRNASALAAGPFHVCAIVEGGQPLCWGENRMAQSSGTGLTSTVQAPARIAALTDAVEVSAGSGHTCVRQAPGGVACWGDNRFGQLGRGSTGPTTGGLSAEAVPGLTAVSGLSAGGGGVFQCAELADGEVRCWGGNGFGQLRTGNAQDQPSPVRISGLTAGSGRVTPGAFFRPSRSGEGLIVDYGISNGQPTIVLGFYTYDAQGRPLYLIGSATISGTSASEISVPVVRTSGARFGTAFNAADVVRSPWGSITLRFLGCDAVIGSYRSSDPAFTAGGPIVMQRLGPRTSEQDCAWRIPTTAAKGSPSAPDSAFAGTWFDQARNGEGVQLSFQLSNGQPTVFIAWYTYDTAGAPLFITGTGTITGANIDLSLITTRGPAFGPGYDVAALQVEPWGTARLSFADCGRLQLTYTTTRTGFSNGALGMQRLLTPAVNNCTP